MSLKCKNCGYKWNYKGGSKYYATCPQCLRKVKVGGTKKSRRAKK